ncbi:MAG TPA: hypothetical protein VFW98_12655 [Gemmatimonadaceae bacterium]|nr:hypothetical protein [Gemmatimonadaceae bacterium]
MTAPRNTPIERVEHVGRLTAIAGIAGIVGFAATALGLLVDPRQAFASYLVAYAMGLSLALGALLLVMIGHVSNAIYFVVLRRVAESAAATLPLFALLFVPIVLGMRELYPWVAPAASLSAHTLESIAQKRAYLNVPFFILRAFIYFVIWTVFSRLLRRWSLRQDTDPTALGLRRQRQLAAGGLPPVALALTFAAFDWFMSLSPAWYSSIYGVYYFAGIMVGGIAMMAVLMYACQRTGLLTDIVTPDHYHALGKLLLTFVIFWAYIAFAQYLIIWIADIPEEATWYLARTHGSWAAWGMVVLVGNFVLPFLILLSRNMKRRPRAMAVIGIWLLFMHYADLYWLIMPSLYPDGVHAHWLNVSAVVAVGGLALAYGVRQLRGHAVVPRGDAQLERSLEYGQSWAIEE